MGVEYFSCSYCQETTCDGVETNVTCDECGKVFCEECHEMAYEIYRNKCRYCVHCNPYEIHPNNADFLQFLFKKYLTDFDRNKLWMEYIAQLKPEKNKEEEESEGEESEGEESEGEESEGNQSLKKQKI